MNETPDITRTIEEIKFEIRHILENVYLLDQYDLELKNIGMDEAVHKLVTLVQEAVHNAKVELLLDDDDEFVAKAVNEARIEELEQVPHVENIVKYLDSRIKELSQ
jgi:hypothetical protein